MLTREHLESLGFIFNEESPFENIKMSYYVKDSVLLFFNEGEYNKNSFLIGYGEHSFGIYNAVTFRWISTKEQLHEIYKAIKGTEIKIKKHEKQYNVQRYGNKFTNIGK